MFLDTSGLFCFIDAADTRHSKARRLLDESTMRITHHFVVAEFVALCQTRRINRNVALDFVDDLLTAADIEIVWTGAAECCAELSLLRARADKTYSLCDAVSFDLMRQRNLTEALTTDRHFSQEGFVALLET